MKVPLTAEERLDIIDIELGDLGERMDRNLVALREIREKLLAKVEKFEPGG